MNHVFDLRGRIWTPELNARIGEYQTLAKAFFEDLKKEGIITFDDVREASIDEKKILYERRNIKGKTTIHTVINEETRKVAQYITKENVNFSNLLVSSGKSFF